MATFVDKKKLILQILLWGIGSFVVIGASYLLYEEFFNKPETIEAKLEVQGWGDDENTVLLKNGGSYDYAKLTKLNTNELDYLKSGLEEEGGKVFLIIDTLKVKEEDINVLDNIKRVVRETEKYATTPPPVNVDSIIKARADSTLKAIEDAKPKDTIYVEVAKYIGKDLYRIKNPIGNIRTIYIDLGESSFLDLMDSMEAGVKVYTRTSEFLKDTANLSFFHDGGDAFIFRHRPPGMKNYGGSQLAREPVVEKTEPELADDESADEEKEKPVAKPEEKKKSKPSASKTNKNNKSVGNKGRKLGG